MDVNKNEINELMSTYRDAIYCFENKDYIGTKEQLNNVANNLIDVAMSKRGIERVRAYKLANIIYSIARSIA